MAVAWQENFAIGRQNQADDGHRADDRQEHAERDTPAAISAVISLCRWIHETVNIAEMRASSPPVRSKTRIVWNR